MKIGIDIRCLLEKNYSGISEYTYNLLNELLKIDQKNQYFLFYNELKSAHFEEPFKFSNVFYKKFNFPNKLFNLLRSFFGLPKVDRLISGVDVFLMPGFLFASFSKNCRKILVVHDLSFEIYPKFFTYKKRLWHKLIKPKKMCREADLIVSVSENTKNDLINLYQINPEKIKVIYPGLSEIFIKPIEENQLKKIKEKYQLPNNFIFYLGNLEPRKNLESLIKAFELIKEPINLVVAGSLAWKYQKIKKYCQKSKKKDRIKFLGYVPAEDKPALYSLAKIFIYPSIYEGFGLPVLETMACGTPVITSANSSLIEVASDSAILIDPYNINDLVNGINLLLNDEKLQQILRERGIKQAAKFNWSNVAREFLKIIESGAGH